MTPGEHMEIFFIELKYELIIRSMSKILSKCGVTGSEAGAALRKLALMGENVLIVDSFSPIPLPYTLLDEYNPVILKKEHSRKTHHRKKNSLYKEKCKY